MARHVPLGSRRTHCHRRVYQEFTHDPFGLARKLTKIPPASATRRARRHQVPLAYLAGLNIVRDRS
jgi:hypothetical protein